MKDHEISLYIKKLKELDKPEYIEISTHLDRISDEKYRAYTAVINNIADRKIKSIQTWIYDNEKQSSHKRLLYHRWKVKRLIREAEKWV